MSRPDANSIDVGFDAPAVPGMDQADIHTPCLVLDLAALERNIAKLGRYAADNGVRHRAHGKMHKSVDVAKLQVELGGAAGVCCQKVAEAQVFAAGGIKDVLVSNQATSPGQIARLARMPKFGARISVCVDTVANVADLSKAAVAEGTELFCLVELEVGANRCGVETPAQVVEIATAIDAAPNLTFDGIQAYQGAMQHDPTFAGRRAKAEVVAELTRAAVDALTAAGLPPRIVTGGGTGSFEFEATLGVHNEIQCGSYAFMDADYARVLDADGQSLDQHWENALFILTGVMSVNRPGLAICDAGLKVQSVDSGLPVVFGRDDVEYTGCSDEHGTLTDPGNVLRVGDKLRLVPGHCDPTCNIHDWYVGVRDDKVETLWPVSARGKAY